MAVGWRHFADAFGEQGGFADLFGAVYFGVFSFLGNAVQVCECVVETVGLTASGAEILVPGVIVTRFLFYPAAEARDRH